MPFGLPSVAAAFQRNMRSILAGQEARKHAVLADMETALRRTVSISAKTAWCLAS